MSYVSIRRALEKRLDELMPPPLIAWEGVTFDPPANAGYIRADVIPATSDSPTVSGGDTELVIERGIFQLTLSYPAGQGMRDIMTQAEILRAWFPQGLTMSDSAVNVVVSSRASVTQALPENGDRIAVVVSVPYFSNVFY